MLQNITKIRMKDDPNPIERRIEMSEEILKGSNFMPQSVTLKDIDESFIKWVENDLEISYEDRVLPTFALFSNQRFSEYEQSWNNVDDNMNILLNFKAITRENNPKIGSIYGKTSNVPTKEKFLMKSFDVINKNGNASVMEYRMAQPVSIDVNYKLTIITNKYELLNKFNTMTNSKFKNIQCYIAPNGHYMSMKLNEISDESEYNVDDRVYYSQTYQITVLGYLINEDDFEIENRPVLKMIIGNEGVKGEPVVEIEDMDGDISVISVNFDSNSGNIVSFKMNECSIYDAMVNSKNIRSFRIKINGRIIDNPYEPFDMNENDDIELKAKIVNPNKKSFISFKGRNKK